MPKSLKQQVGMKQKKKINLTEKEYTSSLFSLTQRSVIFLALMLFALVLLYVSGNFQQFLDTTQKFILILCAITAILQVLISIAGTIESFILFFISKQKRYWIYFALYLLCAVIASLCLIIFRVLTYLSDGL